MFFLCCENIACLLQLRNVLQPIHCANGFISRKKLLVTDVFPYQPLPEILGKGCGENTFCKKGFPHEITPEKKKSKIKNTKEKQNISGGLI